MKLSLPFLVSSLALALGCHALAQEPERDLVKQGFAIMHDQRGGNCSACHSIPDAQGGKTGIQSNFAPALDGVGSRRSAPALRQWVTDARSINKDTRMPPYGVDLGYGKLLTEAQLEAVIAALASLK